MEDFFSEIVSLGSAEIKFLDGEEKLRKIGESINFPSIPVSVWFLNGVIVLDCLFTACPNCACSKLSRPLFLPLLCGVRPAFISLLCEYAT